MAETRIRVDRFKDGATTTLFAEPLAPNDVINVVEDAEGAVVTIGHAPELEAHPLVDTDNGVIPVRSRNERIEADQIEYDRQRIAADRHEAAKVEREAEERKVEERPKPKPVTAKSGTPVTVKKTTAKKSTAKAKK